MSWFPNIPFRCSPEAKGKKQDLNFLKEDKWLQNTELRYNISERSSRWHVTMIYIAVENPFRFRCRQLQHYDTQRKAETFAEILQRGIRKDPRRTLKANYNAFNICTN